MPTILELMNAQVPETVKSKLLKPVLDGKLDKVHDITVQSESCVGTERC